MTGPLLRIKNPASAGGLAGCRLRCSSLPERLLGSASSIPPSKEDDEPKNHDEYEHAGKPDVNRAHERLGGGRAALL
jgi:hypothetical protein